MKKTYMKPTSFVTIVALDQHLLAGSQVNQTTGLDGIEGVDEYTAGSGVTPSRQTSVWGDDEE